MLLLALGCGGAGPAPYRNAGASVEARVSDLLSRMTPEEKFWQLYAIPDDFGGDRTRFRPGIFGLQIRAGTRPAEAASRINDAQRFFRDETRLGIPIIPFEEALHGVTAPGATVFPQAIALAATWDTSLVAGVAAAIAAEARSRGIRQVLSPVINLASDVRWGRVEETYGEDPFLTSVLGVAFVRPFERAGIVTTPKHFVANVGDGGRDSYPVELSERILRELHFPPFRALIQEGNSRSVMAAYNSVDGLPATASPWLLTQVLRQEWGFGGYVFGDAGATGGANVLHYTSRDYTESTAKALTAGLDVMFQTSWEQHRLFQEAFTLGLIPPRRIDQAVARVLRTKFELGLFEHPYADTAEATRENGSAGHRALALEAARKAITLLRNDGGLLPLPRPAGTIAVIGGDAVEHRFGGYSGAGNAPVSILDGIQQLAGPGSRVIYSPGPRRTGFSAGAIPATAFPGGLAAEYFDNPGLAGTPRVRRRDTQVDFTWTLSPPDSALSLDWYSARWSGSLQVPGGGPLHLGVVGNDGYRLYLDDRLVLDNWRKQTAGRRMVAQPLAPGRSYRIRLEYFENTGNGRIQLVWDRGAATDSPALISAAADLARKSAVAIIVAGIEEGEFRDRSSLALPGSQETLIEAVAATGTPTIVVLVGGSAVTMPWLERVAGVVETWYPGEVGGQAVAEVLFGDVNPAGRLPITFPRTEGQLPLVYNHKPTGRGDDYLDGTGQGLFPFGFGLSYTTFEYGGLSLTPSSIRAGDTVVVRLEVKNVGARAGDEVVQLYLRDELASVVRPVMQLAGFQRLHLAPGERQTVTLVLRPEHLSLLDEQLRPTLEPGTFRIMVGASSRDIRLRSILTLR